MSTEDNNNYFSYQGRIKRKNYAINMGILTALFLVLSFIRFENLSQFITYKALYTILIFMVNLLKFVIIMSMISIVYRRFEDISYNKSYEFKQNMRRLYIFIFVLPIIYIFCIRYFIDIIPLIQNILDLAASLVFIPLEIITSLIITFIKGD